MNLDSPEQKRESSRAEEEALLVPHQATRFLLGLLGDKSVSDDEMKQLRQLIRDPKTPLGREALDIRRRLEVIWEVNPNSYRMLRELFHPTTDAARSENDVGS